MAARLSAKARWTCLEQAARHEGEGRRVRSRKGKWRPHYAPKLTKRTALLDKLKDIFRRFQSQPMGRVVALINPILRGWVRYFAVGDASRCFGFVKDWVEKKVRRHLMRARGPRWRLPPHCSVSFRLLPTRGQETTVPTRSGPLAGCTLYICSRELRGHVCHGCRQLAFVATRDTYRSSWEPMSRTGSGYGVLSEVLLTQGGRWGRRGTASR
jgi:hypothetical protein